MKKPPPDKRAEEIRELLERAEGKPPNWLITQLAHLMAKREGQAQARGLWIRKQVDKEKEN